MSGISPRDLERLSAYLDGALQARDRDQLQRRLRAEAALASALKDLEGMRALVQRVPQRRPPRSFTLTQAMVGAEPKRSFAGWNSLNLVSAVATLMLVIVLAGDFWAGGLQPLDAGAPAAEEAPQAFLAQEGDTSASQTPTSGVGVESAEETEELERHAPPEETGPPAEESAPFGLRTFMLGNARPLEIGLGLVAFLSGVLAWRARQRRRINSR